MDSATYSFYTEWFDANANLVKKFIFKFYSDGQIEMMEYGNGRTFLKKIFYPDVVLDDLYIGSTITVYSRQLNVVGYADKRTEKFFEVQRGRTFSLLTAQGYNQVGEVLAAASQNGFVVSQLRMVRVSSADAAEFVSISDRFNDEESLVGDVVVAMELVDNGPNTAADTWMEVANKINAKYNNTIVHASSNACARAEAAFFFSRKNFATTAVFDNCTVAIIKPDAIRRGCAGSIVDSILAGGYEIAALEMFFLDRATATEFFDVYKGVLNGYSELLTNMVGGPCIALQIRGAGVVDSFREFCGPVDVEVAKALYPDSLRAQFGKDAVKNAIHCTDLPEDGVLESQFFFRILQV